MQKGVSIFFEMHEQGFPHIIAGIYSPSMKTEDEMKAMLVGLLGCDPFNDRYEPVFINHTHLYAHSLLGHEMDDGTRYTLSRFFPEALEPQKLPVDPFKFEHRDVGAYQFIWDNLYREQIREHRDALIKESSDRYKEERKQRRNTK